MVTPPRIACRVLPSCWLLRLSVCRLCLWTGMCVCVCVDRGVCVDGCVCLCGSCLWTEVCVCGHRAVCGLVNVHPVPSGLRLPSRVVLLPLGGAWLLPGSWHRAAVSALVAVSRRSAGDSTACVESPLLSFRSAS